MIISLLLGMATFASPGCNKKPPPAKPTPPKVIVSVPIVHRVTNYAYFTGKTQSVGAVDIRARVVGFLQKIYFTEGDHVEKGQLLFEIDPDEFNAAVAMQLAKWQAAVAQMSEKRYAYEKVQIAFNEGAVTKLELANAKAQYDYATAQVAEEHAAWTQANINLGYCKLYAPIAGEISRRLVDVGNVVGNADTQKLATVVQQDPLYVYFDISENGVNKLLDHNATVRAARAEPVSKKKPILSFDLGLGQGTKYPFTGVLDYSANTIDSGTGTLNCRGLLANNKRRMMPGMFSRIRIPIREVEKAILVPRDALGFDQSGSYVYVINEKNIVEHRNVELGSTIDEWREVTKGLAATDRLVTKGLLRCRPGQAVTPEDKPLTAPTGMLTARTISAEEAKRLQSLVPTDVPSDLLTREPKALPTTMPSLMEDGKSVPIPTTPDGPSPTDATTPTPAPKTPEAAKTPAPGTPVIEIVLEAKTLQLYGLTLNEITAALKKEKLQTTVATGPGNKPKQHIITCHGTLPDIKTLGKIVVKTQPGGNTIRLSEVAKITKKIEKASTLPTITVAATYPGADAETVEKTVALPIENQVQDIKDVHDMSSVCSADGTYVLTITFEVGDLDMCQVLVQNRVSLASDKLPEKVRQQGIRVQKVPPTKASDRL